jgi:VWFA-related protein
LRTRRDLAIVLIISALSAPGDSAQSVTLTVKSDLVVVPALVKTRAGERVYSLTAQDFSLTDNGLPQMLHLEEDADREPLALAVIVQTGGRAATHLKDYQHLEPLLDAVIGDVRHTVAVIRFDSKPFLAQDFTESTKDAAESIASLEPGGDGVAILDAIEFGIGRLKAVPPRYRRAILLISETFDKSSQSSLEGAVRAIGDTNTTIYSLAFSSARAEIAHHAEKIPRPGGTPYSHASYAPGGCMSRAPGADTDAHGNRAIQAWDCAGDLLPPLRIAEFPFFVAKVDLQRNVPEAVARLTGGEYFNFRDAKSLDSRLIALMNDVPNHYVLSFRPTSPTPGSHSLRLNVTSQPELVIEARSAYWIDDETLEVR